MIFIRSSRTCNRRCHRDGRAGTAAGVLAKVDPEGCAQSVDDTFAVTLVDVLGREVCREEGRLGGVLAAVQDAVKQLELLLVVIEEPLGSDIVDHDDEIAMPVEGAVDFLKGLCLFEIGMAKCDRKPLYLGIVARVPTSCVY